jgi:hypothetical protein
MKWLIACYAVYIATYGLSYSQTDKSIYNSSIQSETGDTGLIVIYGKITEVGCLFSIKNVHVKYGKRNYFINNKDTDPVKTDAEGNYIIEIRSFRQNAGLSFNYWGEDSHADFYVPIPDKWKGKQVHMDIGLKLLFTGGLDCF